MEETLQTSDRAHARRVEWLNSEQPPATYEQPFKYFETSVRGFEIARRAGREALTTAVQGQSARVAPEIMKHRL